MYVCMYVCMSKHPFKCILEIIAQELQAYSPSIYHHIYLSLNSTAIIKHKFLPYLTCKFLSENSLVTAGYDCYPVLWNHDDNNQLTFMNRLDQKEKKITGHLS